MPFEWHPKKAESNLEKHGVSFEEAVTAFDDPFAEFLPDLRHSVGEGSVYVFGRFSGGPLAGHFIHRTRPHRAHHQRAGDGAEREQRL